MPRAPLATTPGHPVDTPRTPPFSLISRQISHFSGQICHFSGQICHFSGGVCFLTGVLCKQFGVLTSVFTVFPVVQPKRPYGPDFTPFLLKLALYQGSR